MNKTVAVNDGDQTITINISIPPHDQPSPQPAIHCCDLSEALGSIEEVKAALSQQLSDGKKDILSESLNDVYFQKALEVLANYSGKHTVSDVRNVLCDTLLPLKASVDDWKTAQPLTKIKAFRYPFGTARPSSEELNEVYKATLAVMMKDKGNADIDSYVAQMFGKSKQEYRNAKSALTAEAKALQHTNVKLKLIKGSNLLARDRNGTSSPFCIIGLIQKGHQELVASARQNLVDLYQLKGLELESEQSTTVGNTVNPGWNEDFELPIGNSSSELLVFEVWDNCCDSSVKLKDLKLSKFGWAVGDDGEGDDYMGRAFLPLSKISAKMTEISLPLFSRSGKRQYGELRVGVSILTGKPQQKERKVLPEYTKLAAAVLDFESHKDDRYVSGWDGKISPLGYKLLCRHAALSGITIIQQASILFSLLQKYGNKVKLSITAYGGLVKAVGTNQQSLPAYGDCMMAEWVLSIYSSLNNLEHLLIGILSRHHEYARFSTQRGIDFMTVHLQLLKALYSIVPYVEQDMDSIKDLTITVKNACQTACSHLFVKETKSSLTDTSKRVSCFLAVVEFMTEQLKNSTGQINDLFQSVGVDYFTLFYLIIDKELSTAAQLYNTNYMSKGSVAAYLVYLDISDILSLFSRIPESHRLSLKLLEYKEWFRSFAGDWVSTACTLFQNRVKEATEEIHKSRTVTGNIQISHSAFDVMVYIQQISTFWSNLYWGYWTEYGEYLIRVVEAITQSLRSYASAAYESLKSSGHSDETSFVTTELFCINLNDIECMKIELNGIPELLNFALVEQFTSTLQTLHSLLINATEDVKHYTSLVVSYVGKQISNDIDPMLRQLLQLDAKVSTVKALDPLVEYLSAKMTTLQAVLFVPVLQSILTEMWNIIVGWSIENTKDSLTMETARRMKEGLKELEKFFYCNGKGLPLDVMHTEEYKGVVEKVALLGSTNEELILLHLKTLADWSQAAEKPNGEVSCTVAYIQSKGYLEVTVIKGVDLPSMDIGGSSDPYVEVLLMPEDKIKIKAVKTVAIKGTLNPYYGKEFTIKIKPSLLNTPGAVLTFSVYDVNMVRADEFMGMCAVQCKDIPQLKTLTSDLEDPSSPQRMNTLLTLVRDTKTPALEELKSRKDHYVEAFNNRHNE